MLVNKAKNLDLTKIIQV